MYGLPYDYAVAVVPSDGNDLEQEATCIYVGVTGDVTLTPKLGGAAVLFKGVPAGTFLNVRTSHVNATGTTATNLLALS